MADPPKKHFASRGELLAWINGTLGLALTKIEQTASGAVACQLMDALHPGSVAMAKVDFNSRSEYDSINNYKALQAAFDRVGVDKPIDVAKLIKARPLDNIEFMQWFKSYFDATTGGVPPPYDGPARRALSKTGDVRGAGGAGGSRAAASADAPPSTTARAPPAPAARSAKENTAPRPAGKAAAPASTAPPHSASADAALADARLRAAAAERERDFYFDKLRDIEVLCQAPGVAGVPAIKLVERVLYAADEAEAKGVLAEAGLAPDGSALAAPAAVGG